MYKSTPKFPCPHFHEKTRMGKTTSSNWRFSIRTEVFGSYKKLNQFWLVGWQFMAKLIESTNTVIYKYTRTLYSVLRSLIPAVIFHILCWICIPFVHLSSKEPLKVSEYIRSWRTRFPVRRPCFLHRWPLFHLYRKYFENEKSKMVHFQKIVSSDNQYRLSTGTYSNALGLP